MYHGCINAFHIISVEYISMAVNANTFIAFSLSLSGCKGESLIPTKGVRESLIPIKGVVGHRQALIGTFSRVSAGGVDIYRAVNGGSQK